MDTPNLFEDEEEINRLLEDEADEVEETPYEKEQFSETEVDDSDEDPTWEPENEPSISGRLQEDIKKTLQKIQQLGEKKNGSQPSSSKNVKKSDKTNHVGNPLRKRKRMEDSPDHNIIDDNVSESSQQVVDFPGESVTATWNKGGSQYTWKCNSEVERGKIPRKNIVNVRSGPTPEALDKLEPLSCFNLFFTEDIMDLILIHTNSEIARQRENYKDKSKFTIADVTLPELNAYFGLLVLSAVLKDNHVTTDVLFDPSYCGNRYIATMSEKRFQFLTNCLRFDEKETRHERLVGNPLAPVSEIWELLLKNCEKNYKPSMYVTIDEQLVGFRGKCKFRMYIPSKPDKYGLKILMMCDNSSKYMVSAVPYVGKGSTPPNMPAADHFVNKLTASIKGSNRNVTMDNWFCSVPLVEKMLKEDNLTVVGTVRKNKPHIPSELKDTKFQNRKVNSSIFLFNGDVTIVSYMPKLNKIVLLISTLHGDKSVNNQTLKPEIIMTYNSSKGAVDSFDQMCHATNHSRKTKRWTMCFFYNMLNIASINSFVIYCHNYYRRNRDEKLILNRQNFMLTLHRQLCEEWQRFRVQKDNISKQLKTSLESVLEIKEARSDVVQQEKGPRKYCSECSYTKRRHTTTYCLPCRKPICGEHQIKSCSECMRTFLKEGKK